MIKVGIQGGRGSFNEQAVFEYITKSGLVEVEVVYLFSTDRVLESLKQRLVDQGQFAIHNTLGGEVVETRQAKLKHDFDEYFKVLETYSLKISHCLMIHPEADIKDIRQIITHDQVLKQCAETMRAKYPHIELIEGKGDLISPAFVGEQIAKGALPKTTATLTNVQTARLWDLKIIEQDLQDAEENFTTFNLVKLK